MFINAVLDKFSLSEFRKFGLGSRSQKASVIKFLWLPLTAKMVLHVHLYPNIFYCGYPAETKSHYYLVRST